MLEIIIPIKNPKFLNKFINGNREIFNDYPVIVIDSGGGEKLKEFASTYIQCAVSLWEARKIGYDKAVEKFVLNLDSDVIIPRHYITMALKMMIEDEKIGAISIFFEEMMHRGVLEYGASIIRTDLARKLYDYKPEIGEIRKISPSHYVQLNHGYCECLYMWEKIQEAGYKVETLPIRAKHLRENNDRTN